MPPTYVRGTLAAVPKPCAGARGLPAGWGWLQFGLFFVVVFCGWWVCLLACWLAGSLALAAQEMVPMDIHGWATDVVAH